MSEHEAWIERNPYPTRGIVDVLAMFAASCILMGILMLVLVFIGFAFMPPDIPISNSNCVFKGLPCAGGTTIFVFIYFQSFIFDIMFGAEVLFGGVIKQYQRRFWWKCVAAMPFILAAQISIMWQMKNGWWI